MRSRLALLRVLTIVLIVGRGVMPASAAARPYFSLSTARTFQPGEQIKIHLYSQNVDALEFRVYRVRDPEKFFAALPDPHSFGTRSYSPAEQIDERTWLEKFHDWKHHLWFEVRQFFRGQFSTEARDAMRERQAALAHRSRIVGVAEFAQIPLLNANQLVARWRMETPPTFVSDSQDLPLEPLASGVYLVEATNATLKAYTVVIVSRNVLVTKSGPGTMLAFCADRVSGAPLADVPVVLWANNKQQSRAITAADGTADLTIASQAPVDSSREVAPENVWAMAQKGDDIAVVTPWSYSLSSNPREDWSAYIYTDRPVYRPGHTVHFKAILRTREGDTLVLPRLKKAHAVIEDPDQKKLFDQELVVSSGGSVSADLELPAKAALGYYTVQVGQDTGASSSGSFYVEEYKKPEYQVKVTPAKSRVLQGESIHAVIEARYFFGEPVANAKVKYVVHTQQHYFFGEDEGDDSDASGAQGDTADTMYDATEQSEQEGQLDENGRLTIQLPTRIDEHKHDVDYRIEARVTDAANREVAGHNGVLATYGSYRLIITPSSYEYRVGETPKVTIEAKDYDDKPVAASGRIEMRRFDRNDRDWTVVTSKDFTTGAAGLVQLSLPFASSGSFQLRAAATTPENREIESLSWLWLQGTETDYGTGEQQAKIIADKKQYKVGDTAKLLLLTGVKDAHVLLTTEGNTIQSRQLLSANGDSLAFDIPITPKSQPDLIVSAVFVKEGSVYSAAAALKVPPVERTLQVTITPSKPQFQPGERASFDVQTLDSTGQPVAAEISFGEVDEALYSVRPDTSGDVVQAFYPKVYPRFSVQSSLEFSFSGEAGAKSPLLAELARAQYHPRLAQVKPGSDLIQPKIRKTFPDTAYWNPSVRTNPDGHAHIELQFPDSLTTWRTTVRAVTDDTKAGSSILRVITRKNLIVRLATPRFFRKGDEVTLSEIVHNYLSSAKTVHLTLDVKGLSVVDGAARDIVVPQRGEATLNWRVKAASIGQATLVAKALTNEESDALELTLPVNAFGVHQFMSKSGVVVAQSGQNEWTFSYPQNTDSASHGLDLSVSPSVAGTIFSALGYLTSYPYGCTEQTMSSFLPNVIVAEAIQKLNLASPVNADDLQRKIDAGTQRLYDYQHDDGGWGWWKDDDTNVFMTAYVVSGLGEAKSAGYKVDEDRLQKGGQFLKQTLSAHPKMIPDLRAYVTYALAANHSTDAAMLDALWARRKDLDAVALALTGLAMQAAADGRAAEAARMLEKKADATDSEAHWEGAYDQLLDVDGDTSSETTAYSLKLLVATEPQSPLISKAALWLTNHRSEGYYWDSTKQTAMVIFGLVDYLQGSQELSPDANVEVLVNGRLVWKKHFATADAMKIPEVIHLGPSDLGTLQNQIIVRKSGTGRAYWSATADDFSSDKKLYQAGKLDLNLTRDYFKLTKIQAKPTESITYSLDPLSGALHAGDVIAVRMSVSGTPWKYLLVEDPIPAGTEFIERDDLYTVKGKPDWWQEWYSRREFHDDHAAIFQTFFPGRRDYFYLLKVVNPGIYQVSPAMVQPMYQPGVQATSDPARIEVQP